VLNKNYPKLREAIYNLGGHYSLQEIVDMSIGKNDKFAMINAEHAQLVNMLIPLARAGKLDVFIEDIENNRDYAKKLLSQQPSDNKADLTDDAKNYISELRLLGQKGVNTVTENENGEKVIEKNDNPTDVSSEVVKPGLYDDKNPDRTLLESIVK
jgi:hypothetical protein